MNLKRTQNTLTCFSQMRLEFTNVVPFFSKNNLWAGPTANLLDCLPGMREDLNSIPPEPMLKTTTKKANKNLDVMVAIPVLGTPREGHTHCGALRSASLATGKGPLAISSQNTGGEQLKSDRQGCPLAPCTRMSSCTY